jgi:hypothetical protein
MRKVRGNYVEFDPENVGTRRAALLELAFPFQNATRRVPTYIIDI